VDTALYARCENHAILRRPADTEGITTQHGKGGGARRTTSVLLQKNTKKNKSLHLVVGDNAFMVSRGRGNAVFRRPF
jgi:hypothetical protein